jgi:outer membrane protein assembly factor BamB
MAGVALLAGSSWTFAGGWPAYRGPEGDGIVANTVVNAWPADGPKRLWTIKTPGGFSSFAVADGKAFTMVTRESEGVPMETCVALDAASGKELWATPTGPAKYRGGADSGVEGNRGGDGPRSTPNVSGNKVYVYSPYLVLHCLDRDTGKPVWAKDVLKEFDGQNIAWESALSPVVDGDLVYIAGGGAGQAMLAFRKATGEIAWKTGDDRLTQATPVVVSMHGVRQVLFFMQSGLISVDAATGKELWKFAFPFKVATACSPVVCGDVVLCTAGYEVGGAACQVTRDGDHWQTKELWRVKGNAAVASLWSTPVCRDGFLYGMISFKQFGRGPLKCVDLKTGAVKWEQPGFGAGNVVLAGDHLLALADDGQVVLVEANPAAYQEVARSKAVQGKCWSTPAVCDGRLYVRSTQEGACFDLKTAN